MTYGQILSILEIIKKQKHYFYAVFFNFVYLIYLDISNPWYLTGLIIVFIFQKALDVSREYNVRRAIENNRTDFDIMFEDLSKDVKNYIIVTPLFILYIWSFIHIFYLDIPKDYLHIAIILMNFGALASQITLAIYHKKNIKNSIYPKVMKVINRK